MKKILALLGALWVIGCSPNAVQALDEPSAISETSSASSEAPLLPETGSMPQSSAFGGNPGEATRESDEIDFDFQKQLEEIGADELLDQLPLDAKNLMDSAGIDSIDYKKLLSLSPKDFFAAVWELVLERLRQPIKVFAALLGTVLLCAMLESLKTALWDSSLTGIFSAVSVVCISGAVAAPILDCISSVARSIQECATFVAAFIPIFSSVVTVSGQPVTATTYTAFLFLACQVTSQIVSGIFVPLMGIYLAFCIAGNLAPGVNLAAVAKGVRQVVNWALGLLLTLFVALMSLQTAVASGSDHVMSKTAKFLIGSFIPVVGGALGDAMIAAQGYMKLLKTSVGVFGILAALMTFLPIFLQTVIWYLTVNLTGAVAETLEVRQAAEILKSASSALGVLMAVVLCFALLIIISTSLVLMTMGG